MRRMIKMTMLAGTGAVLFGGSCVQGSAVGQVLDVVIGSLVAGVIPGLAT